MKILDLK